MATTTSTTDRRPNRSDAEWEELALGTIVPALQAGTRMKEIRAQYGAGPTIRAALDRVGYNTRGEKVDKVQVKLTGKKLADYVAKLRLGQGPGGKLYAWWQIEHITSKAEDELKALLAKHGYESVAAGRVTRVQANEAAAAKPKSSRKAKAETAA